MFADGFHSMDEGCCLGDGLGDITALKDREGSWGRYSQDEEGTRMDVCLIYAADLGSNISMTILNHTRHLPGSCLMKLQCLLVWGISELGFSKVGAKLDAIHRHPLDTLIGMS